MYQAFYDTGITSVALPESIKTVGNYAFARTPACEVEIPSSVLRLDSVFQYCTNLTNVVFHTGVAYDSGKAVEIGVRDLINTFFGCSSLVSIIVPDTVTNMIYTFSGCTRLKHIDMAKSLLNIGDRTFKNCNNLSDIAIPDSVTNIGSQVFIHVLLENDQRRNRS